MDQPDFKSLVLSYKEELKPFAISLTRNPVTAEDLCQETVFKAFAYSDHYQSGTNIKAWLCTIMRNIFINDYRRNQRKSKIMEVVREQGPTHSTTSEINIRLREIQEAIHNLPRIFKTACILYLEGYKYQEIALALNEPLGTIKSRIHFARKILQKQLDR